MEALFEIDDAGRFHSSDLTRGGWDDVHQHGSPPSGLLARAVELVPTVVPMQVVRFTIDLFRPVPIDLLTVETLVRRNGARIQVVDALLRAGDLEVGRASALKIRTIEVSLPEADKEEWVQPPGPESAEPLELRWALAHDPRLRRFHTHAIEIRSFDRSFVRLGPGLSWIRLLHPLVAGEEPTAFVRLATLADISNGNSQALDPTKWVYVNPDITLYAHRMPVGEWLGMRSAAHQHDSGIGLADTRVFDVDGPLGRINQAQLIEPQRRPATG